MSLMAHAGWAPNNKDGSIGNGIVIVIPLFSHFLQGAANLNGLSRLIG